VGGGGGGGGGGPTDRKMVINGASTSGRLDVKADSEGRRTGPTGTTLIGRPGQTCATACAARSASSKKRPSNYRLNRQELRLLISRSAERLALVEKHVRGSTASRGSGERRSIFRLSSPYAKEVLARGSGTYFYCPRWSRIWKRGLGPRFFEAFEKEIKSHRRGAIQGRKPSHRDGGSPPLEDGTRSLYELREHSAGLNIGLAGGLTSSRASRNFPRQQDSALADPRQQVDMTAPSWRAYA